MNEEFSKELSLIGSINELRLFCHFTDKDIEQILNEGLYMKQKSWNTTMIELSEEEKKNLTEFLLSEMGQNPDITWKIGAIIIAVPKEYGYNFIEKGEEHSDDIDDMPFHVPQEYILCSIDLINENINYNEYSIGYQDYISIEKQFL